jgi:hypothetical protein
MNKKDLSIGVLIGTVITSAAQTLGGQLIEVPSRMITKWLTTAESVTLGQEVHVKVPDSFPSVREFTVTRVTSGTDIQIK